MKKNAGESAALPDSDIAALKASLSGSILATRAVCSNRAVIAARACRWAHVIASRLGLKNMFGPDRFEGDLAYGLIIARAVAPGL